MVPMSFSYLLIKYLLKLITIFAGQRGKRAGSRNLQEISGRQVGQAPEEVQTTKKGGAAGTSAL
jgi:hypothetical protein